jgi:23S rRNA (pseudouridine1915-N3)-methyltransferase
LKIQIIAVGKIKENYLRQACEDYCQRLKRFSDLKIVEISEEDVTSPIAKEKEARQILDKLPKDFYLIALDRRGVELSSEELADKIEKLLVRGQSKLLFLLSGPLGFHNAVLKIADFKLSLSKLTFPHQLARLILLEQLYRAFKIIKGEPYHY